MKNGLFILLAARLLLCQCSQDKDFQPKIDKDKASTELMKELAPQMTGTWLFKKVQIRYQNSPQHAEINIRKDTLISNVATLTLAQASRQVSPTRCLLEGEIQYGTKKYPVKLDLLAGPWIFNKKGPQAYFLLDYNFPVGYSQFTEPEQFSLERLGILQETFSLETSIGQPTMVWRGLNRGIEQAELIKK